jgi:hypothetical protein
LSRSYFLRYFALGFGCCLGMFAVAGLAALAIVNTGGDVDPEDATPTPLQLKQALEYLSRNGVNGTAGGGSPAGGGGGGAAQATATPGTPVAQLLGGGSGTASVPSSTTSATDVTPQPTTASGSDLALPTPVLFTPPTIVPIQPLAVTPSSGSSGASSQPSNTNQLPGPQATP